MLPIRCFTCAKVIANKGETFTKKVEEEGKTVNDALDELKLERYCCRRMMITYVPLVDKLLQYNVQELNFNNIKIS